MKIGITGGIATGKSTVSRYLQEKGYALIDGDLVAREVVEPGEIGLQGIIDHFGEDIVDEQGRLKRKKLGAIIFADPVEREQLNSILGPLIRKEIIRQMNEVEEERGLVFVDLPLLFESHYEEYFDQILLVYVDVEKQKERLAERDGLNEKDVKDRLASQDPIESKRERSDVIIDNRHAIEETYKQLDQYLASLPCKI